MGLKKNTPGCTCCENCTILQDTFDRADDTDLGADWTEAAGAWAIAGNQLETSSTSAICLTTAATPANNSVSTSVTATINNDGDTLRVIFNYTDSSNYNFVEVKVGTGGYIRTYERSGGADTLLRSVASGYSVGIEFIINVCYYDGLIVVNSATTGSSTSLDGGSFGVGTGAIVGGTVKFNQFLAKKAGDGCPVCPSCEGGCTGTTPGRFEVVCASIGGIPCAAGNGTFVLEDPTCPSSGTTRWLYGTVNLTAPTYPHWELRIVDHGGSGSPRRSITLIYRQSSTRSLGFLLQDFAAVEGYDCPTISGVSIPFFSNTNCLAVGTPTATLTAL